YKFKFKLLPVEKYILPVLPDKDVLEEAIVQTKETSSSEESPRIIGFVGGITERVLSEKLGFRVIVEQPEVLDDYVEINSFVYAATKTDIESEDLHYVLDEVEHLWDETVDQIHSSREVQRRFRAFLNDELRGHVGPKVLERLNHGEVFSPRDMESLLTRWLEFP